MELTAAIIEQRLGEMRAQEREFLRLAAVACGAAELCENLLEVLAMPDEPTGAVIEGANNEH